MDYDTTPENVAQTVAKLMTQNSAVSVIDKTTVDRKLGEPLLIAVPQGQQVQDYTKHLREAQQLLKPFQRKGTAKLTTVASLVEWANRFKGPGSVLYAQNDGTTPSLTCIADYHEKGAADLGNGLGDPAARHCNHRAVYNFPLSKQWIEWMQVSGQPQSGVEMGIFLEDHILDVIDPPLQLRTPSIGEPTTSDADKRLIEIARRLEGTYGTGPQLLGMAKSFTVNEAADYTVTHNSQTGEASIQIKSEHVDGSGQPIRPPKLFLIAIPVFENGPAYRLPVRFQYRKSGATVKFILTIHDPKHAKDHAFEEATNLAAKETGLTLLMGTPEA